MMQTQRFLFIVLIQCGNGSHSGKKPVCQGPFHKQYLGLGELGLFPTSSSIQRV